ncbi:a5fa4f85-2818-4e79-b46a-2963c9cc1745 [Sclerotinia trifoliorum]|uniref:A5fa4f85-2818-4e79-b46a-2963c9cc1745 n=1 Tax=Sclerotinia trifoliorum TaxID=28548 RepID=A0A8H2ZNK9_9HELO|nr:a5fa4f85-2818-4e79-b46a-2963c9cc1745 [Sclerotinia trifoliorum]
MGQTHELGPRLCNVPLSSTLDASIFVPFPGLPTTPLPTEHDALLKILKRHHHRVRANIVKAYVIEKENLVKKFKDDIAKQKSAVEGSRDGIALGHTDRELATSIREDAWRRRNEKELEDLRWLRGPKWLLLLQAEDRKNGVLSVPREELNRRKERLAEEMKGHESEEYEWDFGSFCDPGPDSNRKGEKDHEGDLVMGGLNSSNASPTELLTSANTITPFDIEERLNKDVERLLEDAISKMKEYDNHVKPFMTKFEESLNKGIIDGNGPDKVGGMLKNAGLKVIVPSPSEPVAGILRRKSVSMQSPRDTPTGILKKSTSIQSPSDIRGSTLKKSVKIQTPPENSVSPLRKRLSIQMPSNAEKGSPDRSLVQSPLEYTGGALKKVRLDDPFWKPASRSPHTNSSTSSQQIFFPTNPPTGPANPSLPRRRSDPLNLLQNSTTSAAPEDPNKPTPRPRHTSSEQIPYSQLRSSNSPTVRGGGHSPIFPTTPTDQKSIDSLIGKTFISSTTWYPQTGNYYDLEVLMGDEIEVSSHVVGNGYKAFNLTSHKIGQINIKYFLQDIEHNELIGKTFISSSSYAPKYSNQFYDLVINRGDKITITKFHSGSAYIGFNTTLQTIGNLNVNFYLRDIEDSTHIEKTTKLSSSKHNSKDGNSSYIGKTFIATDTSAPKNPRDVTTLKIRIGDEIKITKYASGVHYVGFNERSGKSGQFDIDRFCKDIERSINESTGNKVAVTKSQLPKDLLGVTTHGAKGCPKDDSEDNRQKDLPVHVGKTFKSTHDWIPRQRGRTDDLEIRYGDYIEVVSHNSGSMYEGYNLRTQKMGQFNISYFYVDIDPLDNIGKIFTARSSQHTSDLTALTIDIGDVIEIAEFVGSGVYTGHNLKTGQTAGRFYIDQYQHDIERGHLVDENWDDLDPLDCIDKIFTATSAQSPRRSSDTTLAISIGDEIKVTKFVSGLTFRCSNITTGESGHAKLVYFRKDIEAANKPLENIGAADRSLHEMSSGMDIDPGSKTSESSNVNADKQSGKLSFSIKGAGQKSLNE